MEKFLALVIFSIGSVAATAPIAASVISGLLLILGGVLHAGMSAGYFWVLAGGTGLAWFGRSAFRNAWTPARLAGWTLEGYRRLLAPDRRARLRLIAGIVLFLGGIAGMLALGMLLARTVGLPRALAKMLAIPAFLGGCLAASGLSFSEEREKSG